VGVVVGVGVGESAQRLSKENLDQLTQSDTASRAEELVTRIVGMLTKMCHFR
jgi:hypothetical protein